MGTMIARTRQVNGWSVARMAIVVLWAVWAGLAWWTAPREATADEARADLDSGRAVLAEFSTKVEGPGFLGPRAVVSIGTPSDTVYLVWRTDEWRVHYVPVSPAAKADLEQRFDESRTGTAPLGSVLVLALLLVVAGLAILITGPAPVIGTRWYWFWIGGLPLGLGLLYWLARERPWVEPPPPALDPTTGPPRRRNGITGFLTTIVASIVASLLFAGLRPLVGDMVIPGPF